MRKLRFRLLFVAAALFSDNAVVLAEQAGDCARKFGDEVNETRSTLIRQFGPNLRVESLRSEIVGELAWLARQHGRLVEASGKLSARRLSLRNDLAAITAASAALTDELRTVDKNLTKVAQEVASSQSKLTDVLEQGARHNANNRQFRLPDERDQLNAYDQKTAELKAEAEKIAADQKRLAQKAASLRRQKADLESEETGLAGRQNIAEQARLALDGEESQFTAGCQKAVMRARALALLAAGVVSMTNPEVKPDLSTAMLKALGAELAVQAFKRLAYSTEVPGIVINLLDVTGASMDERSRLVANNILLVGDYGLALKRLKDQGRLRPGDPSYESLRYMIGELQQDMPSSSAEFTLQSLTSVTALIEGLAVAAGSYAAKGVEHAGPAVMKHLSPRAKQALGQVGYRIFKGSISATLEVGTSKTVERLLVDTTNEVQEHLQQSQARRLVK
jgi:hypothetical protein